MSTRNQLQELQERNAELQARNSDLIAAEASAVARAITAARMAWISRIVLTTCGFAAGYLSAVL